MKVNNWTISSLFRRVETCCVLCGARANNKIQLCHGCQQDLAIRYSACACCALPLPGIQHKTVCGQCQSHAPHYRQAYSFALYAPPLDRMITQLKFQQKLYFARMLGQLMAKDIVDRQLQVPDVLIPVPLHYQRLRQRGYNQALELARPIAKMLGIPIDIRSCRRRKVTKEQSGLQAKQRKSNVRDAFEVTGDLRNRSIAIIDDVMTTGSTVNELAKQLMQAGATTVDVWVCARVAE